MIHKFFLKHMVQIIVIKLCIPSVIRIYSIQQQTNNEKNSAIMFVLKKFQQNLDFSAL